MKVLFKEFITVWTRGLVRWLSAKFDSISIDLTPVEEKLDDVKSDVADVKTAVEHIDFSTLAKQGSNNNISLTTMDEKLGNVVMMTDAEYAAFKSHMETEIANILTPITEE